MEKPKYFLESEDLNKIRSVKILSLLGMQDMGRRVSIRCPIHNERSASMVIYPDGSYNCFGCNANGQNAIDFLIAMGASFQEAIEELKKYI